jgi:hypothetical protein
VFVLDLLKNGRDVTDAGPRMQFYKGFKPPRRQGKIKSNHDLLELRRPKTGNTG